MIHYLMLRPSESSSSSSVSSNDQTIKPSTRSNQSTPPNSQKQPSRLLPTTSPLTSPKIIIKF